MRKTIKAYKMDNVNEAPNFEDRTYRIIAPVPVLDGLERILSVIQYLGRLGATRTLKIFISGKGDRVAMRIKRADGTDILTTQIDSHQAEFDFGLGNE